MVKTELIYNPYLMETMVRFNGQAPKINSLVEKYQDNKLQDWINKIPGIFHDEMNGYDFDLDFTGTKLDCSELQSAFADAGVSGEQVHIFHKSELESREDKVKRVENLLEWLESHPDRKFDNKAFRLEYRELFDESYSCITVQGVSMDTRIVGATDISVENVENTEELKNTDLINTPVIFYISRDTLGQLESNLRMLIKRQDIISDQIFFYIHPALDRAKVQRIISDLGMKKPQIVSSVNDESIRKYFKLYPVTEYICKAIKVFREKFEGIGAVLDEENKKSEVTGKEIHARLDELEDNIKRLKEAKDLFEQRDNLEMPEAFRSAEKEYLALIANWRNKKTKMTKEDEARTVSKEFDEELGRFYKEFCDSVVSLLVQEEVKVRRTFDGWYKTTEMDSQYLPDTTFLKDINLSKLPMIADELMKLKEEQYVTPKEDIFGYFFKTTASEQKEPVLETTYYYQAWREEAQKTAEPLADKAAGGAFSLLQAYAKRMADEYTAHLEKLIAEQSTDKDEVASWLSEDEKLLQNDNDWLVEVTDQLKMIERG